MRFYSEFSFPEQLTPSCISLRSKIRLLRKALPFGTIAGDEKAREQHPVTYWVGRILMMTIGAWIVTVAIMGSWN
jgi:hypothetical protein